MKTHFVVPLLLAVLAALPGCGSLAPHRTIVVTRTGSPTPGTYHLSRPTVPVDRRADDARVVAEIRAGLARHGFTEVADPGAASVQVAFSWYLAVAHTGLRDSSGRFFALRDHSAPPIRLALSSRGKPALGPERAAGFLVRPAFAGSPTYRPGGREFRIPSNRPPRMLDRPAEPTVHYLARLTLTGFTIVENQKQEVWKIVAEADMTRQEVKLIESGLISAATASLDPNAPPTSTFTFSPSRRQIQPLAVAP